MRMPQNRIPSEHAGGAELSGSAFSSVLLRWYEENRRILPWREDPTPYHVWLSEIMLQQTRVEAVKGYYDRFLASLPSIEALAEAEEDLYLKLWEGLGYYSRVRNLKKAAVQIMTEHGGRMPGDAKTLLTLSGIGEYTAAAVASIAYGERIPAVDGNLLRVFSRLTAYNENILSNTAKKAAYSYFLERMPAEDAKQKTGGNPQGAFNQALMDLGATVCLPVGEPRCRVCPFVDSCRAYREGRMQSYPVKEKKKQRTVEEKTVFLLRGRDGIAIRKRPNKGLLAGLYEFPNTEGFLTPEDGKRYVESLGYTVDKLRALPEGRHIFTHKEWHMHGFEAQVSESGKPALDREAGERELFFAEPGDLYERFAIPSAFSVYLDLV